jgi:hypothetical protein
MKAIQNLLAAVGIAALGATAAAQSELETVNLPATYAMVSGTLTFDVPQFDPSLGTLNSVVVTLTPSPGAIYPWDYSTAPQTITDASVNSPVGSLGVQSPSGQSESIVYASSGFQNGAPQTFSFTAPATSVTVGPSGFVGAGDNDLTFTSSATATSSGSGVPSETFVGWNGMIGGDLSVDYNYTAYSAVPEPATVGLLATGLLGVLRLRRRNV